MRIYLDTNILLDVLIPREDRRLTEESAKVLDISHPAIEFCISILSVTTCMYFLRKLPVKEQKEKLSNLLEGLTILPSSEDDLRFALASDMPDPEDAMQTSVALCSGCLTIITRDRHYKNAPLKVMTPAQFFDQIQL